MCQWVRLGDRDIYNFGQLKALVGAENIVEWSDEDYPPEGLVDWPDENCLCGLDLAATARKSGYWLIDHDGDSMMSWWLEPGELARLRAELARLRGE